ncbi:Apolipoprotein L5 [Dissostichus eleginoides]|uniref:Apolipoprotein L5 n=1 Tax=Dissostichus eleginoides TaxID=100907 RepID=A0AAD9EQY6_DISEL|nr:Apolipoprotein L5 [Dissostichus eleginoides]
MPPKPPRTKYLMKSSITASCDVTQPTYEDPDAPMPTVTDGSHSDVNVKPVPRPRSRIQPKSEHNNNNNNNTVDSSDTTSDTTDAESSQLNERPADFKTPRPVRPSSRPPLSKYMTSRKPTTAVYGGNHYMISQYEPNVRTAAVSPERKPPSPGPARPPPPCIDYARRSQMKLPSVKKSSTDEIPQSTHTYIMQPSSTVSDGEVTYSPDRPAVPPRIWASSLTRSKSMPETSPTQTRPPPPCFTPPPPPSINTDSESMYSEIEHYLDVLPEDEDKITVTSDRPTFRSQSGISTSPSTDDKEDIIGMCRWLKRVSKSDCMAPSLYGLSIEEEISSFNERAMNVKKALRLYNLLMMKRSDCMKNIIKEFSAISESLDKMQKKTKTMDIAGGTTGAVGGVTAVLGIAFAPMTLGASLIATAVGAGMLASAGGMGAHTAKTNKKKVVNRMTVEKLVHDYKGNVVEPELCLGFILSGMNELRRHDIARIQRAGAQTDALKVAHLAQTVFNMNYDRRSSVPHTGGMASERLLLAFAKDIDLYFTEKEGQKLKKSINSKFSGRVRLLSENLQEELNQMIRLWEKFG